MSVEVRIKKADTVVAEMLVQDVQIAYDWMAKHHGEYNEVQMKFKRADELRQGREPE